MSFLIPQTVFDCRGSNGLVLKGPGRVYRPTPFCRGLLASIFHCKKTNGLWHIPSESHRKINIFGELLQTAQYIRQFLGNFCKRLNTFDNFSTQGRRKSLKKSNRKKVGGKSFKKVLRPCCFLALSSVWVSETGWLSPRGLKMGRNGPNLKSAEICW